MAPPPPPPDRMAAASKGAMAAMRALERARKVTTDEHSKKERAANDRKLRAERLAQLAKPVDHSSPPPVPERKAGVKAPRVTRKLKATASTRKIVRPGGKFGKAKRAPMGRQESTRDRAILRHKQDRQVQANEKAAALAAVRKEIQQRLARGGTMRFGRSGNTAATQSASSLSPKHANGRAKDMRRAQSQLAVGTTSGPTKRRGSITSVSESERAEAAKGSQAPDNTGAKDTAVARTADAGMDDKAAAVLRKAERRRRTIRRRSEAEHRRRQSRASGRRQRKRSHRRSSSVTSHASKASEVDSGAEAGASSGSDDGALPFDFHVSPHLPELLFSSSNLLADEAATHSNRTKATSRSRVSGVTSTSTAPRGRGGQTKKGNSGTGRRGSTTMLPAAVASALEERAITGAAARKRKDTSPERYRFGVLTGSEARARARVELEQRQQQQAMDAATARMMGQAPAAMGLSPLPRSDMQDVLKASEEHLTKVGKEVRRRNSVIAAQNAVVVGPAKHSPGKKSPTKRASRKSPSSSSSPVHLVAHPTKGIVIVPPSEVVMASPASVGSGKGRLPHKKTAAAAASLSHRGPTFSPMRARPTPSAAPSIGVQPTALPQFQLTAEQAAFSLPKPSRFQGRSSGGGDDARDVAAVVPRNRKGGGRVLPEKAVLYRSLTKRRRA